MATDGKLLFALPFDGNGRLVLGDERDDSPVVKSIEIGVSATFSGDMDCSIKLLWDANVSRGEAVQVRQHWQDAEAIATRASSHWQDAKAFSNSAAVRWQEGLVSSAHAEARWQQSEPFAARAALRWQDAAPMRHGVDFRYQEAIHLRAAAAAHWQDAAPMRHSVDFRYQEAIHLRTAAAVHWQDGQPLRRTATHRGRDGQPVHITMGVRWQDAMRPPVGLSVVVQPTKPTEPPCYDPATLGRLEFVEPWVANNGRLVFVCVRGQQPGAAIVIPVRSVYMVQNSVILYRMPAGTEFEAINFSLDIDADSWTFGWSASLHRSARAHLVRSPSTERVEVQALVNGQAVRLTVDSIGRDRSFPTDRISVSGRGRAAELDEVSLNFDNVAARTAQQLMADVLTVNGVSIGWSVDWQITDWLVPAGAWLHQGSYISALQDIADAAGAYLQPHFTDKVIRVLPRYAQAPWDWATLLTPDIELPVAATTLENTEEVIKPAYNRVFVGGVSMGVFGPVTRDGTAGDVLAPPVTHGLITAAEVHRQRGLAVLSDTGVQEHLTLKTLLLPETGIIMPGKVLRYVTEDGPGLGIVRKTNINMSQWPQMHQTLGVETHVE